MPLTKKLCAIAEMHSNSYIPGQKSVIAKKAISGTSPKILCIDRPLLLALRSDSSQTSTAADVTNVYQAFLARSAEDQASYLQLYYNDAFVPNKSQLEQQLGAYQDAALRIQVFAIFQANSIKVDAHYDGVYKYYSRFNHRCFGYNAFSTWNGSEMTVHSLGPIAAGEEICVCYLSRDMLFTTGQTRQNDILTRWHFTCQCPACANPHEHDARRSSIQNFLQRARIGEEDLQKNGVAQTVLRLNMEADNIAEQCRTERLFFFLPEVLNAGTVVGIFASRVLAKNKAASSTALATAMARREAAQRAKAAYNA